MFTRLLPAAALFHTPKDMDDENLRDGLSVSEVFVRERGTGLTYGDLILLPGHSTLDYAGIRS